MINNKVKFKAFIKGTTSFCEGYIRDKTLVNSTTFYIIETDDSNLHMVHPAEIIKIIDKI